MRALSAAAGSQASDQRIYRRPISVLVWGTGIRPAGAPPFAGGAGSMGSRAPGGGYCTKKLVSTTLCRRRPRYCDSSFEMTLTVTCSPCSNVPMSSRRAFGFLT
eukprot:6869137-Prymnesium_polylepis.1